MTHHNISFSKYFSIEDFIQLNENFSNKIFSEKLHLDKLSFFIAELLDNNILQKPQNTDTHYSFIIDKINEVFDKRNLNSIIEIAEFFDKMFFLFHLKSTNANVDTKTAYDLFIKYIDKGNFDHSVLECNTECSCCGKKITLKLTDWKLSFVEKKFENNKFSLEELTPCYHKSTEEITLNFPTGEILIADWFRIEAFTDFVKYNKDYTKLSINSLLGQIASTQHAANNGFLTVHVGNSSPSVYKDSNNNIYFGHSDLDEPEDKTGSYLGYVCTDLWNVTMIDKSRLIDIVAESSKINLEQATSIVDEYIEENKNNLLIHHINPGDYKITFLTSEKYDSLHEIDKKNDFPQNINTIISVKQNTIKPKLKR